MLLTFMLRLQRSIHTENSGYTTTVQSIHTTKLSLSFFTLDLLWKKYSQFSILDETHRSHTILSRRVDMFGDNVSRDESEEVKCIWAFRSTGDWVTRERRAPPSPVTTPVPVNVAAHALDCAPAQFPIKGHDYFLSLSLSLSLSFEFKVSLWDYYI